ncbi:hypothetical protein LZ31DRAFT_560599 [Colletotrichum somersetense]|nr:hypothetical protein LZ31DRAFT_560599 [Colletotrichum somersetense]
MTPPCHLGSRIAYKETAGQFISEPKPRHSRTHIHTHTAHHTHIHSASLFHLTQAIQVTLPSTSVKPPTSHPLSGCGVAVANLVAHP